MIKYFIQKWKDGLNIGRREELHYLERQRIATLNALGWVILFSAIAICISYSILEFSNKYISLLIIPFAVCTIWLNHERKYILAKNVLFFGSIFCVNIWAYADRRTGVELLFIALAYGSVTVYKKRLFAYLSMILCALMFLTYKLYDFFTPFTTNPELDYLAINLILAFATGGVIFFQAIINADISYHISKKHDKNITTLKLSIENQKISDEKLKTANNELSDFNQKLDFLVKKSVGELQSYQTAIDDNLNSVVTNYDGIILKINAIYLEKTGYTNDEIIGKNIDVLKSDYHDEPFFDEINKTLISGNVWRGESKIKTKYGENLWLISSILPIKDNSGKIIKFLTISADITDKKEAEEKEKIVSNKLSKSETRLSLLLEHQTDLIVSTDKFGNRNYVNQAFCDFFGKDKDYFIGTNYRTLNPEIVDQFYIRLFDSISYKNPKITITIVRENALGEKRWIKWDEVAYFNANKEVVEILSIGHDITEMKENEFQNANYIAQFEELAFKNSHHFRKPLSNILGVINLIDSESTEEEINELLGIIKTEIIDLDTSSQELSNFINTHSKNQRNNKEIFNSDFINAKLMHLKWKYKIKHYLNGEGSLTENQAISPFDSEFGKWYYTFGKDKYGHLESVQKFEIQHEKLHLMVREILKLQRDDKKELAEKKYKQLLNISDKIIILIDEAEQYINNKNAETLS